MLKVHEVVGPAGEISPVFLRLDAGALVLVDERGGCPLPEGALAAVMARFGAPLDPGERVALVAELSLGGEAALRHVRHLARYDVIARDYLVYARPGQEPVCAPAATIAGALAHLADAARRATR